MAIENKQLVEILKKTISKSGNQFITSLLGER